MFLTHDPDRPLNEWIELIWLYQGDKVAHERERVLPNGNLSIIIPLHEEEVKVYEHGSSGNLYRGFRGCLLSGAHSTYSEIDTLSQCSMMGIEFKPGGVASFLPFPAIEIHNLDIRLDEAWGPVSHDLHAELMEATSVRSRFQIVEKYLLRKLKPDGRHPAVRYALNALSVRGKGLTIENIADQIGLSQRRLIDLFCREVGLTPKRFERVIRLQEALRQMEQSSNPDWLDIVFSCSYYDHAHFIHDFRLFAGMTPQQYIKQRGEFHNHIALDDAE